MLVDETEQECQLVNLLSTVQQKVCDVAKAKHSLELQVSSLSEEKKRSERYYCVDDKVMYFICMFVEILKNWSKKSLA